MTPAFSRTAALVAATACAPAWASSSPLTLAAWFSSGATLALAAALLICWLVLHERVVPRSAWQPFAVTAAVVTPAVGFMAGRWPLLALCLSLAALAWGLLMVHRLSSRMQHLLEERDRARAAATQARKDSERDALTGALNRATWRQRLEQLANDGSAMQPPRPLSVLFFDIDLFKLINDSLGHGVGDDCLRAVSACVAAELRGGDVLGRMGGEEFAVALPGARRIHAIAVAERIRVAVQGHCRIVGEEVVELTVSIGAAEYLSADESLDALVDRADRAMYNAKDSGRNMVVADAAVPAVP
ncbi:MAG: GGDEF domain-containing protein [Arenimonas sp.]|uniref:GGDEF domain-containing protein n=1 Tax=Arenimonas sp. TaxID=1872635 RepID=UPI0025C03E99|nr:GGDEF domain-containing protein [Arenimonas sp.]MBW8367322.1 GGDEF domain-containing protein [Arenimonas sp.]